MVAVMTQAQPLFTKVALDQVALLIKGGQADVAIVAWMAAAIFVTDLAQTLISNVGGYWGDMLSIKMQKLLCERYYEHLLSLPQRYFDQGLIAGFPIAVGV